MDFKQGLEPVFKLALRLSKRVLAVGIAWIAAWSVYMIAMLMTTYDGLLSLIFQPFMGALAAAVAVGASLATGLLLRVPIVGRWWWASRWWAATVLVVSMLAMCFGSTAGLTEVYTNPETGDQFTGIDSRVGLASYFAMTFSIVNWPMARRA